MTWEAPPLALTDKYKKDSLNHEDSVLQGYRGLI